MKVLLYMASTVNGFIATDKDETPWSEEVWNGYYTFVRERGNIILGRKTYDMMKAANEFEKLGSPVTVVISHTADQSPDKMVTFVTSAKEAVGVMKQKGMKEVVVGGGSAINAAFLKEDLLDELYLDIDPLLFGKGVPLFAETENIQAKLELIGVQNLSKNTLRVHYRVVK